MVVPSFTPMADASARGRVGLRRMKQVEHGIDIRGQRRENRARRPSGKTAILSGSERQMAENSLAPTLLLAMPQMTDPNFARSVVLLCRHESEGAMGLVVNRKTSTLVSSVVELDPPLGAESSLEIWVGGPVEPERGWLLLGYDPGAMETIDVGVGLHLSASVQVLRRIMEGDEPQPESRFLLGYAGWSGGQLESELAASAWLTAPVSKQLIFGTPAERMWETAIRSLGVDPYSLQMGGGVH
jgi:putative transcriptional regulator